MPAKPKRDRFARWPVYRLRRALSEAVGYLQVRGPDRALLENVTREVCLRAEQRHTEFGQPEWGE